MERWRRDLCTVGDMWRRSACLPTQWQRRLAVARVSLQRRLDIVQIIPNVAVGQIYRTGNNARACVLLSRPDCYVMR